MSQMLDLGLVLISLQWAEVRRGELGTLDLPLKGDSLSGVALNIFLRSSFPFKLSARNVITSLNVFVAS